MATVKRFEELVVWQMADAQCASFQRLAEEDKFGRYRSLMEQMDSSSGSVMDNIAEGFDRNTRADFRHFLIIARGSHAEFRSQLYRAAKRGIIDENLFGQLKHDSEILGVKLHHFISYLSQTSIKDKPPPKTIARSRNPKRHINPSSTTIPTTCLNKKDAHSIQPHPTLSNSIQQYPTASNSIQHPHVLSPLRPH